MKVRNTHRRFMNSIRSLSFTLLAASGILSGSQAVAQTTNLVPNGDFSIPGPSADWFEVQGGNFVYSYPTTGGNPNDFGIIDGTPVGTPWAIWVNGNSFPLSLTSLGMTAGNSYTFKVDMKVLSSAPNTKGSSGWAYPRGRAGRFRSGLASSSHGGSDSEYRSGATPGGGFCRTPSAHTAPSRRTIVSPGSPTTRPVLGNDRRPPRANATTRHRSGAISRLTT